MRREKEFRQQCCRNSKQKWGERKRKRGREKVEEFWQHCYRNSSAQNAAHSVKKKQLRQRNCRKRKKKKLFWQLWQCHCRKWKKKLWNLWMSKKKSCHVHNIFTINHTWLIIISSKNLWKINCGNGIAENVKKKLWNLWMSKKKKLSRTQYFYNIFTINHMWLIIISSKNLWQINSGFGNCGNAIAENVKKINK